MPNWNRLLSSNVFLIFLFLIAFVSFLHSISKEIPTTWNENDSMVIGTVTKVKRTESGEEVSIHYKGKPNLRLFLKSFANIQIGDQIQATGSFQRPSKNTIPNGFNYQYYLWYHREKVTFQVEKIAVVGRSQNLLLNIKRNLNSMISKRKNASYLSLFLLGDSSKMDTSSKEGFRENGISHLFSISGMHFSLLIGGLSFLLFRKKKESKCSFFILNLFLIGYLFLIDFIPSACRAFLLWEFLTISKLFQFHWSKVQCFCLMMIVILFWKPFYIFDVGFQFSATLSFFLCQSESILKKKSKLLGSLYFSTFAFFSSLPLALYYYFSVNLLSIVWNLILVPFVTIILFPIQILSFFFPFLSGIAYILGMGFETVSNFLSKFQFLTLIFHKPFWCWIVLYYLGLFLFLKRWKRKWVCSFLIGMLFFLYHYNFLIPQSYFLMIDVGQGDSLLIHSHNQTMLVDTGGYLNKSGVIYENTLEPLLHSLGIRELDILCLTHGDLDHVGEAYRLLEEMKVNKVYFNEGTFTKEEKRIQELLKRKRISYDILREGDIFTIGNFSFFSLNKDRKLENDSSIVLLGNIDNSSFLLMGDASKNAEKEILKKYHLPSLLFLKVGHHGSKTSSSFSLLNELIPRYSLISVGEKNFYGHPSPNVISLLNQFSKTIYMTSKDGSIFIKFRKNVTFLRFPP